MSPEDSPDQPGADTRIGRSALSTVLVPVLLGLPVAALLAVPFYARVEPRLGGVPFFYWYQALCLLLTAVSMTVALVLTERRRPQPS